MKRGKVKGLELNDLKLLGVVVAWLFVESVKMAHKTGKKGR